MPSKNRLIIALIAITLPVASAPAEETRPAVGEASMPLAEILRLYRENEEAQEEKDIPPPLAATVNKIDLTGRLLADAIDLRASFEVAVLADGDWVSVPLVKKDDACTVHHLPRVGNSVLAVDGDDLVLITQRQGIYAFELGLLVKARPEGRRRTVALEYPAATLARLLLEFDEGLFRLVGDGGSKQPDGVMIYPRGGRFEVTWERLSDAVRPRPDEVKRPPIESVVRSAHAAVISTLEGQTIVQILYRLRFEGTRPIAFQLPAGQTVEKVFVNGIAVPFGVEGQELLIEVAPARAGDQSGTVELVLRPARGGYLLSGDLLFALPSVSWPVNELYADVHLPLVFNYTWTGGSLSQVEESPQVGYTYEIPRPGKRLAFHQYLIARSTPTLRLSYAIDLTEQYFGP